METREKLFLERLAELVPGVKGYRAKEARRDTDKRLREALTRAIDRSRGELESFKRGLLEARNLDLLGATDRVGRKLQKAADSLRYASYGYAGLFAEERIEEEELERLYAYDQGLVEQVEELGTSVERLGKLSDATSAVKELEAVTDGLNTAIEQRKDLFGPSA